MAANVYAELIRLGLSEEVATAITETTYIHDNLVTKKDLLLTKEELEHSISRMENKLLWGMVSSMLGMTTIFGLFLTIVAWIFKP